MNIHDWNEWKKHPVTRSVWMELEEQAQQIMLLSGKRDTIDETALNAAWCDGVRRGIEQALEFVPDWAEESPG